MELKGWVSSDGTEIRYGTGAQPSSDGGSNYRLSVKPALMHDSVAMEVPAAMPEVAQVPPPAAPRPEIDWAAANAAAMGMVPPSEAKPAPAKEEPSVTAARTSWINSMALHLHARAPALKEVKGKRSHEEGTGTLCIPPLSNVGTAGSTDEVIKWLKTLMNHGGAGHGCGDLKLTDGTSYHFSGGKVTIRGGPGRTDQMATGKDVPAMEVPFDDRALNALSAVIEDPEYRDKAGPNTLLSVLPSAPLLKEVRFTDPTGKEYPATGWVSRGGKVVTFTRGELFQATDLPAKMNMVSVKPSQPDAPASEQHLIPEIDLPILAGLSDLTPTLDTP